MNRTRELAETALCVFRHSSLHHSRIPSLLWPCIVNRSLRQHLSTTASRSTYGIETSDAPPRPLFKMSSGYGPPVPIVPAVPRPSSSVLLISPTNEILLLHRVHGASSFASAHVFPGGNVDPFHDGEVPAPNDPARHEDGRVYRLAAIRETFEESGIVLARNNGFGRLIEVEDPQREAGRKLVHERKIAFEKWLAGKGGRADVGKRCLNLQGDSANGG